MFDLDSFGVGATPTALKLSGGYGILVLFWFVKPKKSDRSRLLTQKYENKN
jgi:hypothetical protein